MNLIHKGRFTQPYYMFTVILVTCRYLFEDFPLAVYKRLFKFKIKNFKKVAIVVTFWKNQQQEESFEQQLH